jgi:hypothetical protein
MRKLLIGLTAAAALGVAAPASAQVYFGAGPGGVEVGVGGPRYYDHGYYGHRYRPGYRAYAYGDDCRVIRSRVETPSGRVIIKTRRVCR